MIIHGDALEELKKLEDKSVDAVVSDPPYGLGTPPDPVALMKDWIEKGYHEVKGTGFMGKTWDAFVPQPIVWKEVYRVLKPGGHLLSFFGTRTYDWGVMALRFAGFEIRDMVNYLYGSGFPKSHNIGKAVDKLEGNEREFIGYGKLNPKDKKSYEPKAKNDIFDRNKGMKKLEQTKGNSKWEGWGTALKPAQEPIVLARKPLEGNVAQNCLKWGVGGINVDGCRVSYQGDADKASAIPQGKITTKVGEFAGRTQGGGKDNELNKDEWKEKMTGRFPANLILSCECDEVVEGGEIKIVSRSAGGNGEGRYGWNKEKKETPKEYKTKIEKAIIHTNPNCPCALLDEMSGNNCGSNGCESGGFDWTRQGVNMGKKIPRDKGGASRFFYCAKSSKSERNFGLEGFEEKVGGGLNATVHGDSRTGNITRQQNNHPTVKPIKLMQYLCRLITPKGGTVLDPYMGSGSTGIACKLEGFEFIGIEREEEYVRIAEARIKAWGNQRKLL